MRLAALWLFAAMTWPSIAQGFGFDAARTFTHSERLYAFEVPVETEITKPGGEIDVAIRSPKGYEIIVRTGDAHPGASISGIAATLEALYLGPDKPWSTKIEQKPSYVARMVTFEALYEGPGIRSRVAISRGRLNIYVFILQAPIEVFETANTEFDRMLRSFRPAPGDAPPPSLATMSTPLPPKPNPAVRHFVERRLGYSIDYPGAWALVKPSPQAIIIGGPEGTDAYEATVSIQNVAPYYAESATQAVKIAIDELHTQFEAMGSDSDVAFERQGPYIYQGHDELLLGRELLVEYGQEGRRFRQWTLVVPRSDGAIAHVWTYRSPAERFDRYLPTAETMLANWSIEVPGRWGGN